MQITPYVILYLLPAGIATAIAGYNWRRGGRDHVMLVSLLMASVAVWCVCHALSIASMQYETVLFWSQVQYFGIVLVPPLFALFALAYTGHIGRIGSFPRIALFIPAVLALAAVLSNNLHHLWWEQITLNTSRAFYSLDLIRGPFFWAFFIYTYACILFGMALFAQMGIESPPPYRRQAWLLLIGAIFPLLANLAHVNGFTARIIDDPTPILFVLSGAVFFYAGLRYQLFDLVPLAQREILANLPDGVIVVNMRGDTLSINAPAIRLLGLENRTWVGQPIATMLAQSPIAHEIQPLVAVRDGELARACTYTGAAGLQGVEVRARPLYGRNTRVGTLLLLHDTTDRELAQRALDQRMTEIQLLNRVARATNAVAETNELLRTLARAIVETLPWERAMIALFDADETTLRLTIDQPRESGKTHEGIVFDLDRYPLVREALASEQALVINGDDSSIQQHRTLEALRQFPLYAGAIIPLIYQQQRLGVLLTGRNATEHVAPEELHVLEALGQLGSESIIRARLYENAEHANKLKSIFLANVSHELRTPLTSIIGYTEMLQRGIFGMLPAVTEEPLGHIRHNSLTLLRLINDLLDFSRLESGRFGIELYPIDTAAVIREVAGGLRPQITERGLKLELVISNDLPPAYANASRLEQVMRNLLMNAIKFTDTGTITVRAYLDTTPLEGEHFAGGNGTAIVEPDAKIVIEIEDTGIGIAPEYHGLLFQAFRQIDSSQGKRYGGTGLGLAISRGLLDAMGGRITFTSTPGRGTTFICELRACANIREQAIA